MGDRLLSLLVLFLLFSPVWAVMIGPHLARVLFFNVCYFVRPYAYTLHGNLLVAAVQSLIALGTIWAVVGSFIYHTDALGCLLPDAAGSPGLRLLVEVFSLRVVGAVWFGFVLWPGLYLTSRFVLLFSAQYGLKSELEELLASGSVWIVMASVLACFAMGQSDPEISRDLFWAIIGVFFFSGAVAATETALFVSFVDAIFYALFITGYFPSRDGIPALFEPTGMFIYMAFVLPVFCMQVAIEKRLIVTYLHRVNEGARFAFKEAATERH